MQALNGGYGSPDYLPMAQPHYDAFLGDLATQMAITEASKRLSRHSNGQRLSTAMRVSKPSSANNSPRASAMYGRRRTMVTGGHSSPRSQRPVDYVPLLTSGNEPAKRQARPLSWHPNSQLYTPQAYFEEQRPSYPMQTSNTYTDFHDLYAGIPQLSPMLTPYSTHTSPSSSISPMPATYFPIGSQYLTPDGWATGRVDPSYCAKVEASQDFVRAPSSFGHTNQVTPNDLAWSSYVTHGMSSTSPPTPESFLHPQAQPAVSEHGLSYQSLKEPEDEGEILVGMGLYDTSEKFDDDPQLNNYRSTVTSLLGSTFHPHASAGKGLKLEETWEPPKSDDEDEAEDEDDNDASE